MASRNYHAQRIGDILIDGNTISCVSGDINFIASTGSAVNVYYGTGSTTSFGGQGANTILQKSPHVVTVSLDPGAGDFTSIAAAVDSITGSSYNTPYSIKILPGVYVEPIIDLSGKEYISVTGEEINSVLVIPDGNHHVFNLGPKTEISFISVSGATSGYAAFNAENVGDFAQTHKTSIYDCDIGVNVSANDGNSAIFYGEYMDINGKFSYGVKNVATSTGTTFVNLENFYAFIESQPSTGGTHGVYINGEGAEMYIRTCQFDGGGYSGSTGICIFNGGYCTVLGASIEYFDKGVWNPNTGVGAIVQVLNCDFDENFNYNVLIENTDTKGAIQGVIDDHTKVVSGNSENITLLFSDRNDGELHISRAINMRFADGISTDVSTLWLYGQAYGVMSGGTLTQGSGLTLNVLGGYGYSHLADGTVKRLDWSNDSITLPSNSNVYVYYTSDLILSQSSNIPDTTHNIVLGRVVTNASSIAFIDYSPVNTRHLGNQLITFNRNALGTIYRNGSLITEVNQTTGAYKLNVGSGEYYFGSKQFNPVGSASTGGLSFTTYYRSASPGIWTTFTGADVNSTQYDDGTGTLASVSAGYYTKHSLYVNGDGIYEQYFLVLSQGEYADIADARTASLPNQPSFFTEGTVLIGAIICQQGAASITEIIDARPIVGYKPPVAVGGGITDHGDLTGLGDDDHTQYLLVNGGRSMAGNLNMGGNMITNSGNINGVSITAHSSRHLPNGSDPLTTGTPVTIGAANAEGIANSFARSDHVHAFDFSAPSTITTVSGAFDFIPIFSNALNGSYKILVDNMNIGYLKRDGTRQMSGGLDMGGNAITGTSNLISTNATINNLTGSTLYFSGASTILSLSMTTGTITNGRVTTLTGTTLIFTGTSTLSTLRSTTASIDSLTCSDANITGTLSALSILAEDATLTGAVSISNATIGNTLTSSTIVGNVLSITGNGTIVNLSSNTMTGANITVTGSAIIGSLSALSSEITTLTGTTLTYTGTSTLTTLTSTNGRITTLTGTTLTFTGTSTLTTLSSTNANITTLTGTTLTYTGTSTLTTLTSTNGRITTLTGTTLTFTGTSALTTLTSTTLSSTNANITTLTGTTLTYTGTSTLTTLLSTNGRITTLTGTTLTFTGTSTLTTLLSTNGSITTFTGSIATITGAVTMLSTVTGPTSLTMNAGAIQNISRLTNTGGYVYQFPAYSGTLHLDTSIIATGTTGDGYNIMLYNPSTRLKVMRTVQEIFPHGEMYMQFAIGSGTNFTPGVSNTWYHLVTPGSLGNSTGALGTPLPTTFNTAISAYVDSPTGGVMRYTGNDNYCWHSAWTISIATNTAGTRTHYFAIAISNNGVTTLVPGSEIRMSTTDSGFFVSTTIHSVLELAPGNRVSIAYLQNGGTNTLTLGSFNAFMMGMPC